MLTVSISGESYIGKAGDAFVVSPGNLHLMGSQTGTVDYFTFLFPLKYISFRTDDMLDDKLLEPLNSGHLMINPRAVSYTHLDVYKRQLQRYFMV